MLNLVFHQGYERRDDYARAIRRESRHLKRDALASTRRHKAKGIPARTNTLDNLTLDAAEIIITPVLAENVAIDVFFLRSHMLSAWLYVFFRWPYVLYLKLHLVALKHVCLQGVGYVKRPLRLDIPCRGALPEGYAVDHRARLGIYKLQLDVFL